MTLTFDAVSKVAEIYINGELAGSHIGMFGEIQVDGSKLLKSGKNLVVVKVVSKQMAVLLNLVVLQLISSILLFVRVKRKMGKYQRRVIF